MNEVFPAESLPPFYARYVKQVNHLGVIEALEYSSSKVSALIADLPEAKAGYAYAPGKWTIRELISHMMDAERVFSYRAFCFSRNEKINLPAFDEDAYVKDSDANRKSLAELGKSLTILRASTLDLFRSFSEEMFLRTGTANNTMVSVRALGYLIAGHDIHHYNVLRERYLS